MITSQSTLRDLVVDAIREQPRHLQEIYHIVLSARPGATLHGIRARLYEEIQKPAPRVLRVDEGVYVAVDGPATAVFIIGDAWEKMRHFPDEAFNLIVTDAPYRLGTDKHVHKSGTARPVGRRRARTYEQRDLDEEWLRHAWRTLKSAHQWRAMGGGTKPGGGALVLFAPAETRDTWRHIKALIELAESVGFQYEGPIQWVHDRAMGYTVGGVEAEPLLTFTKRSRDGGILHDGTFTNVIRAKRIKNPSTIDGPHHEAQKPAEVTLSVIRAYTRPGDIVLDPFAGDPLWARAAVHEGRHVVLVEHDARWIEKNLHDHWPTAEMVA